MDANLCIFLICMGILAVALVAIVILKGTPSRIVAVILALGSLIGGLEHLASMLHGAERAPIVAPSAPLTVTASAPVTTSSPIGASPSLSTDTGIPASPTLSTDTGTSVPSATASPTDVPSLVVTTSADGK
ncbi:hypothetical protein ACWDCC_41975 [Streptomyces sp. NPDC001102]